MLQSVFDLQVLLRRTAPPLLVHHVCAHNHDLDRKRDREQTHPTQAMLAHDRLHQVGDILVVVLQPPVHSIDQLLVVLAFHIPNDLLGKTHAMRAAVVERGESRHQGVVVELGLLVDGLDGGVDGGDVVGEVLDAVVQVLEAVVVGLDVAGEHVLDPGRHLCG